MRKGVAYKFFIYFLCFSFLLLTGGFSGRAAEAKEKGLPIGEMISRGEVKFEATENVWKEVEPSHFPIFQGIRVKTEKGQALIILPTDGQIEVGQNSLFSFQHEDQFHLFQGRVSFRIPPTAGLSFRVGNLSIGRSLSLQAAKDPLSPPRSGETVGSISLHSNGSVTVKSIRGPLSIRGQDRVVLAAISPHESVTIPSSTVSGGQGEMVAQIGEYPPEEEVTEEVWGLSTTTWALIGLGAAAVVGGIAIAAQDDDDRRPLCP